MSDKAEDSKALAEAILRGETRSLARALTWVENRDGRAEDLMAELPATAIHFRLGITGAPGVGKSTLLAALAARLIEKGENIAALAVDPTSPVSGGALLGDRMRLGELERHSNIFFRSIASRGSGGGLAACTDEAAELLAHAGYGMVLVETLGVGQLEIEIVEEADSVLLLVTPESGDVIQFLKGGVLEVVDHVVVHKADLPGADKTLRVVEEWARERDKPAPLAVSSVSGEGFDALLQVITEEAARVRAGVCREKRVQRLQRRLVRRVEGTWLRECWQRAGGTRAAQELAEEMQTSKLRFTEALARLYQHVFP
ncbi:MAG: methylmalonyl Co-A mutase-associated GTPase MeaB [Planctomycetota bacterium]